MTWMRGLPPRPGRSYVPTDLHAKQLAFMARPELEVLYGGAAGGGKSQAILADALQYVDRPDYRALVLRRTFRALNLPGSIMARALQWLGRDHWHDLDKRFVFPSGAIIQFGYCDSAVDLERYKSAEFHRIYIDEVTEWPEAWVTFLFSRCRRVVGCTIPLAMRYGTNPDGIGAEWVRHRFNIPEGAIVDDPIIDAAEDRVFLPARAEDNPSLDLVSYEASLSKLSPEKYQQLRWGRWIRDGEGMVYRHYTDANNRVDALPVTPTRYVLGIDYGFRDETAFAVLAWADHDPTVYVLRSWKIEQCIPSRAAELVKELEAGYRFDRIVADIGGLGKGYAEEAIQRWGLPIEAAEKQNKRGYIDLLNGALARGELKIVAGDCDALRKEWLELPWHENHQREADGFANHCADATLYAWRATTAFLGKPVAAKPAPGSPEALEETATAMREKRRREIAGRNDPGGSFVRRWPGK